MKPITSGYLCDDGQYFSEEREAQHHEAVITLARVVDLKKSKPGPMEVLDVAQMLVDHRYLFESWLRSPKVVAVGGTGE